MVGLKCKTLNTGDCPVSSVSYKCTKMCLFSILEQVVVFSPLLEWPGGRSHGENINKQTSTAEMLKSTTYLRLSAIPAGSV